MVYSSLQSGALASGKRTSANVTNGNGLSQILLQGHNGSKISITDQMKHGGSDHVEVINEANGDEASRT